MSLASVSLASVSCASCHPACPPAAANAGGNRTSRWRATGPWILTPCGAGVLIHDPVRPAASAMPPQYRYYTGPQRARVRPAPFMTGTGCSGLVVPGPFEHRTGRHARVLTALGTGSRAAIEREEATAKARNVSHRRDLSFSAPAAMRRAGDGSGTGFRRCAAGMPTRPKRHRSMTMRIKMNFHLSWELMLSCRSPSVAALPGTLRWRCARFSLSPVRRCAIEPSRLRGPQSCHKCRHW